MKHFALQFAVNIPDADKCEKALPPINYLKDKQYFEYKFDGLFYQASEIFSDKVPEKLKEHLKSMSVTEGSTGKRDYCFI